MDLKFLDFEQPIAELEAKIEELRFVGDDAEININEEVAKLREKSESLTKNIFSKLSPWQVAQVARHPGRPYTLDYLASFAPDFQELHGDRMFADDPAIVGGVGRIDGRAVMFIDVAKLREKSESLTKNIFSKLSPWQVAQVARHPGRPYTLDYLASFAPDFQELHGDRMFADDPAIVGGVGRIDGRAVMFIGHQKGRDTKERVRRNYGMPKPEGYRKAQRLMRMAEKFKMPIVTLIDTPGAYPGVGAEERGQSEAIAYSLYLMAGLKTPIISVVIGEGGSGGALAIGVGDKLLMLQYGIYSVISPEGCAAILWKSAERAEDAAAAMRITTDSLSGFGLVDEVLEEPLGGAHRNPKAMAEVIRNALIRSIDEFDQIPIEQLLETRQRRLAGFGEYKEA